MGSLLRKCLTQDGQAVIAAIDATELIQASMKKVQAWPPAMYHLGDALMASALLQALPDRNDDERLELQWKVEKGVFGSLYSDCRSLAEGYGIRGTVLFPQPDTDQLQLPMGPGLFQVRRLSPRLQTPLSSGIVECQGDVVLDVLGYLERSEQKVCALSMWIDIAWDQAAADRGEEHPFKVNHAYGFLVHVLPQDTLEKTNEILFQWDRHIQELGPISKWVLGDDPTSDILSFVSAELKPRVTSEKNVFFFCTCSEDRAARALAFLEDADQREGIVNNEAQSGKAQDVRCEFCGQIYKI